MASPNVLRLDTLDGQSGPASGWSVNYAVVSYNHWLEQHPETLLVPEKPSVQQVMAGVALSTEGAVEFQPATAA